MEKQKLDLRSSLEKQNLELQSQGLCRAEGHTRLSTLCPMRGNVPNDSNNASEMSESSSLGNPGGVTEADYASDVDTDGEGEDPIRFCGCVAAYR